MALWECEDCDFETDKFGQAVAHDRPGHNIKAVPAEPVALPAMPEPRHLGDGAYVSFDGYQLWLAANDHRNRVIALEPGVLQELVRFARQIDKATGTKHFNV